MQFIGIDLHNFRSIGAEGVKLSPLGRCSLLAGRNNAGKSNVARGLIKVAKLIGQKTNTEQLDEIDLHNRLNGSPFRFRLWFESSPGSDSDAQLAKVCGTDRHWIDIAWPRGTQYDITGLSFSEMRDFQKANSALHHLTEFSWGSPVGEPGIRKGFLDHSRKILTRFTGNFPAAHLIPEFRQIRAGDAYDFDGRNLTEELAAYHSPIIGRDEDQQKFELIQDYVRRLLDLPRAILEVSRANPTIIVKNDGLRLPLASYGTGAHEVVILLTAVVSLENSICCIEEPEIHLHPRLQRALIELLLSETTNRYVITTHSPTLINLADAVDGVNLFHLTRNDQATVGEAVERTTAAINVVRDLGLKPSDLFQANCLLWVEGPSDREFLVKWFEVLAPDLVEGDHFEFMYYRQLPKLNGDIEAFDSQLVNLFKINPNTILVMDRDTQSASSPINADKAELCKLIERSGGLCWVTAGREIENYLTSTTVEKALQSMRAAPIPYVASSFRDFAKDVDQAIRRAGVKQPLAYGERKRAMSRKFAEYITEADIEGSLRVDLMRVIERIRQWNWAST